MSRNPFGIHFGDADKDFDLADIQLKERQVLQIVNGKIRDAHFRVHVLRAYSHRCICGVQLDLLDAAHAIRCKVLRPIPTKCQPGGVPNGQSNSEATRK